MTTTLKTLITAPAYFDRDAVNIFSSFSAVTMKQCSRHELLQTIHEYNILAIRVDTKVDKELLDAATNLKVIATATTGTDHIDMQYAKEKEIHIISLTGANTTATAEHAFALLLSLARKIPAAHASLTQGNWNRSAYIGTELASKKLGVVGFGRIGREIAKRAQAFGMQILAYDPYLKDEDFTKNNITKMNLEGLFKEADVITLHVFLTEETKGFVNKKMFALMKPTAFLLNCSRGEVVVDTDLVEALETKKIAGASLDVFSTEPLPKQHPFIHYAQHHDNLILTPHIAGSTVESIHEAGLTVAQHTKEYMQK